jgi:hypothetical protein
MAQVPMGVPLPPSLDRATARTRRGLPADAPVLASFGHINPYKRLDAVFRALRQLRERYPGLRYLLVGSVSPNYDVRAAVERAGLAETVTITGYVDRAAFEDYVAAADVCLNLRHPTAGETSASLLRLLGAGRPTLVTSSGSFAELPTGVAAQVDADASEGDLILAYCRLLLDRPDLAAALGANARSYVAREHSLDQAAAGYMRFLSKRYGWGEPRKIRETPLWEPPENKEQRTENKGAESRERAPAGSTENREPQNLYGGPSVAALATDNLQSAISNLQSETAGALAGLGATEDDRPLLEGAARALAGLVGEEKTRD